MACETVWAPLEVSTLMSVRVTGSGARFAPGLCPSGCARLAAGGRAEPLGNQQRRCDLLVLDGGVQFIRLSWSSTLQQRRRIQLSRRTLRGGRPVLVGHGYGDVGVAALAPDDEPQENGEDDRQNDGEDAPPACRAGSAAVPWRRCATPGSRLSPRSPHGLLRGASSCEPPPEEERGQREEHQREPQSRYDRQGDTVPRSAEHGVVPPIDEPAERAYVTDHVVGAADVRRSR